MTFQETAKKRLAAAFNVANAAGRAFNSAFDVTIGRVFDNPVTRRVEGVFNKHATHIGHGSSVAADNTVHDVNGWRKAHAQKKNPPPSNGL